RLMVLIECGPLLRLKEDGTIDPAFLRDVDGLGCPRVVALLPNGNLLVGGESGVVRLKPNGALDTNFFNAPIDGGVQYMSVQPDGKIAIGGWFQQVGGAPRGG